MADRPQPKENWTSTLTRHSPLQLPAPRCADCQMIKRAGFHAYQIGGFALVGARHGLPDVDLTRFAEQSAGVEHLKPIGAAFKGVPQMTNMFEGDNQTPWLTPMELSSLGFSMILYPTSLLFRVVRAIERGLADLLQGKPLPKTDGVDLAEFEAIIGVPYWASTRQD